MTEKPAGTTKQLGARLDPPLADWIQTTAKRLGITQGDLVTKMQKIYIENDVTQKYPEWSAQIQDVHFWAKSLVTACIPG